MQPQARTAKPRRARAFLAVLTAAMLATACAPTPTPTASKPVITLSAPQSGLQVAAGQQVTVESMSTDARGIARVELAMDGNVLRSDTTPGPLTAFSLAQVWRALPGTHTLTVRAYNRDGAASEPASVTIIVAPGAAPAQLPTTTAPQAAPTAAPTSAPAATKPASLPTAAPQAAPTAIPTAVPTAAPCVNDAAFAGDVTMPDGSEVSPNQPFVKIWRMQNTGTCAWDKNYQLAFLGGEAMSSVAAVNVPQTAAGATADVSVSMSSPSAPGPHTGRWQMRAPDGRFFGRSVDIKINVPAAPALCAGRPTVSTFTASPQTVGRDGLVTLNWGAVTNAERVEVWPDIGNVSTPGSIQIQLEKTTTFRLNAYCQGVAMAAQLTVGVDERLSPTPAPLSPLSAAIIEPANGSVGSALIPLRVTYQGSGSANLNHVELYGNGVLLATQTAATGTRSAQGILDWKAAPGRYELYAVAIDAAGQSATSSPVVVTIKSAPGPVR